MSRYASETSVSAERSRAEIESTLTRYGATSFAYAWESSRAVISFRAKGRLIRFVLRLPERNERRFTHLKRGNSSFGAMRAPESAHKAWEQGCRQAWRALALVIKAKLEAVEARITEFESEFLANIVLPDGRTVGEHAAPQIAIAYEGGNDSLRLLPPGNTQ